LAPSPLGLAAAPTIVIEDRIAGLSETIDRLESVLTVGRTKSLV